MNTGPIFIVGVGRSGTTLIRQMVNSHSKIAIPYESHFITKYISCEKKYGDLQNDENLSALLDDILAEPILENWDYVPDKQSLLGKTTSRDIGGVFANFFTQYANHHGKSIWGDKSDYLHQMHKIKYLYPNAKFIHIVRDGRDVALSVMKMSWGPDNIREAASWWGEHVRLGYSMGRMLNKEQYYEIRYEDLVAHPEKYLEEICQFVGVNFESTMLEFFKTSKKFIPQSRLNQHYNADKGADTSRTKAWKREMSPLDCEIFQQIAGDVLREMNYEIAENDVSSLRVKFAKLKMIVFG
tara:strand:- start:9528 stop:10418 length:891 start_codon:yes stop_codon:yes gene_type:complete